MTYDRAVCPFAKTTFRDNIAFALENRSVLTKVAPQQDLTISLNRRFCCTFKMMYGPPYGFEAHDGAETGSRALGDKHCWTIWRVHENPMRPVPITMTHFFEALDWRLLHDNEGTYMKIGEPFILGMARNGHGEPELRSICCFELTQRTYAAMQASIWEDPPLLRQHEPETALTGRKSNVRELAALILPQDGCKAKIEPLIACTTEENGMFHEHVDVRKYFPDGSISVVLCTFPGSAIPLPFTYRVWFDNHRLDGNVVVIKHPRGNKDNQKEFIHVQRAESEWIMVVLGQWIHEAWNEIFNRPALAT
ncbi:hypothetical protein NMY22_g18933 [Coprinellus aureogranulatus]|nr:hypothetical protein NMY22_g18933 [Coprinellus aureogranulatus]